MKSLSFSILILLLPYAVGAQSGSDLSKKIAAFKEQHVGGQMPNFLLKDRLGKEVSVKNSTGKIMVLNFWFLGCKPCRDEMPLLNTVVEHYKNRSDITFLAPALDEAQKLEHLEERVAFSYQVLPSAKEFADQLGILAYPTHFVVDSHGIIRKIFVGGRNDIDKLLIEAIDGIVKN